MLSGMWIDERGSEVLSRAECLRLLALSAAEGSIGRLAVPTEAAPVVVPVNFAFEHGDVVLRMGGGFTWSSATDRLVAFEVDGVHGAGTGQAVAPEAWSVLVRGLARQIDEVADDEAERDGEAVGRHAPHPLVPVPGDRFLAVRTDVVSGRRFPLRVPGSWPVGAEPPRQRKGRLRSDLR